MYIRQATKTGKIWMESGGYVTSPIQPVRPDEAELQRQVKSARL